VRPTAASGWPVLVGIAIRAVVVNRRGEAVTSTLQVLGAGFIAEDALFGFFDSLLKARPPAAK
jgi:uncharacterized oligopeptide transporter (OPT) family protein